MTSAETEWIQNIAVTTSDDIPMVLEVTFDTPQAATAWVEFGDGSPDESVTASKDATSHEFAVIGGQPLSDVYMRVIVEFDGEQYESGIFTHTTGQQLPEMPTFEVMVNNYDPPESAVLLMSVYNNPSALVMLDFDGQVVWSRGTIDNSDGLGVGVLPMNGEIYYNTFSDNRWRNAQLTRMSLSGEVLQTIDTPDAHHFFTPGPDNEIAWIQYDAETPDTQSPVYGDRIVIGVDNPQPLISTWDHLTFEANAENLPEWTHANWVEYNPERDSYLMSTAFTDVIIEADTDGNPLRIMGGVNAAAGDSDYSFESQESQFSFPHGPHWTSKGDLLVFSTRNGISSAVRYEVDDDTSTLREQWRFGEDLRLNALALGEVQELPDDNILINWGSVGIIQVVEPSTDTVLWEARSGLQEFPAQVHYMDSPYATR
ncbi:MAG: aryl-sulfate sulfotransferase [Myxococcota bacterium]|nr:aryl-sulfate sulfotransferase [Myxococcota bacterium]